MLFKNTKKRNLTLLSIIFLLIAFAFANAEVLFVDDFGDDDVGDEPSNWEHFEFFGGKATFTVEQDPTDNNNKVVKTTGIGQYVPDVAGRENWSDYIWDFDWMWENDSFVGTLYRIEDPGHCFHFSRRQGGVNLGIWACKDAWGGAIVTSQYPNEINVWYSHRLVLTGSKHEVYLKERGKQLGDELLPVDWHLDMKPAIEVDDDTYMKGSVGMMGITSGVSYFDNIVVAETVQDLERLRAVDHHGKLTTTWGSLKRVSE